MGVEVKFHSFNPLRQLLKSDQLNQKKEILAPLLRGRRVSQRRPGCDGDEKLLFLQGIESLF
jgi:hypothetical protein